MVGTSTILHQCLPLFWLRSTESPWTSFHSRWLCIAPLTTTTGSINTRSYKHVFLALHIAHHPWNNRPKFSVVWVSHILQSHSLKLTWIAYARSPKGWRNHAALAQEHWRKICVNDSPTSAPQVARSCSTLNTPSIQVLLARKKTLP